MLEIYALSNPILKRAGAPVTGLASRKKAEALLVVLASQPRPHARRSLGQLLWPDYPEHRALNNLSVLLSSLKKHVGEVIHAGRQSVHIIPQSYWFDAHAFWSCSSVLAQPTRTQNDLDKLTKAAKLYQQDFLTGVYIAHADDFETWLELERRRFKARAVAVLNTLLDGHYDQGQYADGIDLAQQTLALEPFNDHAHERLVHMLALTGKSGQALRHFDRYCDLLEGELQLTPNASLQDLVSRIRKGEFSTREGAVRFDIAASSHNQAILQDSQYQDPQYQDSQYQDSQYQDSQYQDVIQTGADPLNSLRDEAIASGLDEPATSQQSPSTHLPAPFQAPAPPRHFVGRTAEKRYVRKLLMAGSQQPVAIVGMGGLGKSTLANSLAQDLRDVFEDGILWANVSATDPMTVLETWARAYGHDISSLTDLESRRGMLKSILASKHVLMILDDVTDAASARVLLASQGLASQGLASQGLASQGLVSQGGAAAVFTTRDLDIAYSLDATVIQLDELARADSQQLLRHILGNARVAAEADAAREMCQLLHDFPLAVEITAKRLQSRARMPLAAMVTRLRDAQQRMDLKISDLAVRTSFEVSWQVLSTDQQTIFCTLAVFEGRAFNAAVLAHVLGLPQAQAEDELYNLYTLSLVQEDADVYYHQHPLLADFAEEKLAQHTPARGDIHIESAAQVETRVADYYHGFTQEAAQHLQGGEQHEWLDKLAIEYPNIRATIAWAIAHERLELIESYLANLERFWVVRGYLAEEVQLYQSLFKLAETARNNATLRYGYAYVLYYVGDYVGAQEQAGLAFDLATSQADAKALALAHRMLGIMADETGDSERALEHYQVSMTFFEARADSSMVEFLLNDLYLAAARLGQDDLAQSYCEQSYLLACQRGDQKRIGIALLHLGLIALEQANYLRAKHYFSESMTVRNRLQDKTGTADVHTCLAWLALAETRYQDAKVAAETAVHLCLTIGEKYVITYAYSHLAVAEAELGNSAPAWQYFCRALQVCKTLGVKQEGLLCLERIATYLTVQTTHYQQAACLLFSTEQIRSTLNLPRFKVEPSLTPIWQSLRAQVSEDVMNQCHQEGHELGFVAALDYATELLKTLIND